MCGDVRLGLALGKGRVRSFGGDSVPVYTVVNALHSLLFVFSGVKRSYTFGPAGGGYEDPVV